MSALISSCVPGSFHIRGIRELVDHLVKHGVGIVHVARILVRSHKRSRRGERGEKGSEKRAGPRKMPAGRGSHERSRRGEGKKRGPEERARPKKMPAGEGATRGPGVEKGRKGVRGEGRPKKNARR